MHGPTQPVRKASPAVYVWGATGGGGDLLVVMRLGRAAGEQGPQRVPAVLAEPYILQLLVLVKDGQHGGLCALRHAWLYQALQGKQAVRSCPEGLAGGGGGRGKGKGVGAGGGCLASEHICLRLSPSAHSVSNMAKLPLSAPSERMRRIWPCIPAASLLRV